MKTDIGFRFCGVLFLVLVLAGSWTWWKETSPHDAWTLEDPVRIITDFAPQEKMDVSFRLRNTARVPLRILGATAC